MAVFTIFALICIALGVIGKEEDKTNTPYVEVKAEVDLGDGLSYLTTYMPADCTHKAQVGDLIHYHYVGRLGDNGEVFGRSFDYNTPYIVYLGQGRIIQGMDRGLVGTCLWERRRITIPPELGYGERGVGDTIPPNATLVFFIRMIKIERNGEPLGIKPTLEDMWMKSLKEYTKENWQNAVDSIEEALIQFDLYETKTLACLKECNDTVLDLNKKEQEIVDRYSKQDPSIKLILSYAAKANCIKQCKRDKLPHPLQEPDSEVLRKFKNRVPYSYLQFAYYKLGKIEDGLKCAYTYYFHNPNDTMITNSIKFYKKNLKIPTEMYPSREPGARTHQQKYDDSKKAYGEEKWLEATELLEEAINGYMEGVNECLLMCEDVVYINFTDSNMPGSTYELLKETELLPDSMQYSQLLRTIIKEYLKCRTGCQNKMATINGQYYDKYLPGHFNHLQYAYYKLGMLHKTAGAASTFKVLEPSDVTMSQNVKFYRTSMKVPFESFKAREDVVELVRRQENEERLLWFIETGVPKKKAGARGDDGDVLIRDEL